MARTYGQRESGKSSAAVGVGANPFLSPFCTFFTFMMFVITLAIYHRYQTRETLRMIYDLRKMESW